MCQSTWQRCKAAGCSIRPCTKSRALGISGLERKYMLCKHLQTACSPKSLWTWPWMPPGTGHPLLLWAAWCNTSPDSQWKFSPTSTLNLPSFTLKSFPHILLDHVKKLVYFLLISSLLLFSLNKPSCLILSS